MKIYNYSPTTGELISEATARQDPLVPTNHLVPAFATTISPPSKTTNTIPVFSGSSWALVEDYRSSEVWDTNTGEQVNIISLGPLPVGLSITKPVSVVYEKERLEAFNKLKQRIISKRQEKNSANFVYNGHPYVSDEVNIQGVRIQVDGAPGTDPIPTFVGTQLASTWHTADDQFVLFNAEQFRAFATVYFSHREKNFTNYTMLTIMATQAYNTGATVDQLNNFDISQGWN